MSSPVSAARRRLVDRLKRSGPSTSADLANDLGLTEAAVRQHLAGLEEAQLVERSTRPPSGRGRPATLWALTALAMELFPDRHADLTVELISAIRAAVGERGLDKVIEARTAEQRASYAAAMPGPRASVRARAEALATRRTDEGYMAEVREDGRDVILVEHHCPVCEAATTCTGLCRAELELFRDVLGPRVTVTREQHLLSGDERCAYRITPLSTPKAGRRGG
jgi:predicted ArsR family transcriptional regulator